MTFMTGYTLKSTILILFLLTRHQGIVSAEQAEHVHEDALSPSKEFEEKVAALTSELKACEQNVKDITNQLSKERDDVAELKSSIEKVEKERAKWTEDSKEHDKSKAELKDKNEQLNAKIVSLEDKLQEATVASTAKEREWDQKLKEQKKAFEDLRSEMIAKEKESGKTKEELSRERSRCKGLDSKASNIRMRMQEMEEKLYELERHHNRSLIPHWMEESVISASSIVKNAISDTGVFARSSFSYSKLKAISFWENHGSKMVDSSSRTIGMGIKTFKSKVVEYVGPNVPEYIKNPFMKLHDSLMKAWNSDATRNAISFAKNSASSLSTYAGTVTDELETLMVKWLKKYPSTEFLTHRPVSKLFLYSVLGAPLVAFLLPVIVKRRRAVRSTRSNTSTSGTKSRRKRA